MESKIKVCILRSNPVCPDSRVEKEAQTLFEAGYDVHVLAWDRDSDHAPAQEHLNLGGNIIPITRLGYKATFGEGLKNIIPYLKFQLAMRRYLAKNRFDIVHACDFDTAFFSQGVSKRKKTKFIFDIFDFLYSNPQGFLQRAVCKAQISLINKSDATIICTEDRKRQIAVSNPKNLTVIHNTPMEIDFERATCTVDINCSEKPKVVYVGILQDFRLLKEIASYFAKHSELEWHVGGFGKYEGYFRELSEKHDNIKFYGRISYYKTLELESQCDIHLAIYDPTVDNHKFAAPNKFYESLMLGKPVIMVKGTGMSDVVQKNDIGQLIEYSEASFAGGLERLLNRRDDWKSMAERMRRIYRDEFSWDIMKKRLLDLYRTI